MSVLFTEWRVYTASSVQLFVVVVVIVISQEKSR
jgi:hypothetical protein